LREQIEQLLVSFGIQIDSALILSQVLFLIATLLAVYVLQLLTQFLVRKGLKKWIEKTETIWMISSIKANYSRGLLVTFRP